MHRNALSLCPLFTQAVGGHLEQPPFGSALYVISHNRIGSVGSGNYDDSMQAKLKLTWQAAAATTTFRDPTTKAYLFGQLWDPAAISVSCRQNQLLCFCWWDCLEEAIGE
uniref:Putative secreted protein n=1 Tax=Anopheles darlingi TaxID=43151 RepID=A0A2M4DL71_ANODA